MNSCHFFYFGRQYEIYKFIDAVISSKKLCCGFPFAAKDFRIAY